MITIVDQNAESVIQKVTAPKKPVRYQVVSKIAIGDYSQVTVISSLAQARLLIGKGQNGRPLGTIRSNG